MQFKVICMYLRNCLEAMHEFKAEGLYLTNVT